MPTPTIPDGELFMNATLYTGNGSTQTITNGATGQSFQPDFVWLKERSSTSSNNVYDVIRGATNFLLTNSTAAEGTSATSLTSFNSNGFTLGGEGYTNENAQTYVGWQWKAGGAAVTNTAGSISSQVSANTTSGFSIVGWTGTGSIGTIGHGLGVAPKMIFGKRRDGVSNWFVYHVSLGATAGMNLNTTDAALTNSGWWNNTAPTSSVFTMGTFESTNGSPYIAYCFAEIDGYSKFGSYTGNGSTDGTFVYLGFRPRFVLIKRTDTSGASWHIWDTSQGSFNAITKNLRPNSSGAEFTDNTIDILSNGFKCRSTDTDTNASGGTYVYACWAENPFKYSNAR